MVHNPPSRASKRQGQHMNIQEELAREQAAVEVQTANLRELARLVLAYSESRGAIESGEALEDMINFAKGVAQ